MNDASQQNGKTPNQTLTEIVELLKSHYLPLLDATDDIKKTDLSPADIALCMDLEKYLQRYWAALPKQAETAVSEPQPPPPPTIEKHEPIQRRARSKAYDFLLLEALMQRDRYGHPIGQGTLLTLAEALEPATKKGSLISKLNRWRNDKAWIDWADPDDMRLTALGEKERNRLLLIVRREGDIPDIKATFKTVWNIDITLD